MIKGNLFFYKYISAFSLLILGLLVSSCQDKESEDRFSHVDDESIAVSISLHADDEIFSRASNDQDPPFDSYINHKEGDFRILVYNSDRNLLTVLTDRELNFNENNVSEWYFLDKNILNNSPEIYIVALLNWNSFNSSSVYPTFNNSSLGDFRFPKLESLWTSNMKYSVNATTNGTWYPSIVEKRHIPMFGITKINIEDNVVINQNKKTLYITVPVIRALAKISFEVNDELYAKGFDMNYCTITNYNASGFFNPNMSLLGNSMDENGDLKLTDVECPEQNRVSEGLKFTDLGDNGGKKKLVVYLPEMKNSGLTTNSDNRPLMNVSLVYGNQKYGNDKTIELSFNYNSEGNLTENSPLYDVIRNNYYAYTIVDVDEDQKINFKYTICPWNQEEIEIEFN